MEIAMIAAVAKNGIIGSDNDLVWSLPDDMKYFMQTTKQHFVIMGRKNFESIPKKFRPLPNRTNIVVTRNANYTEDNTVVVNSIEDALRYCEEKGQKKIFIIGGGQIYAQTLPKAHIMLLTEINGLFEGDTYFPEYNPNNWKETSRIHHSIDDKHEYSFDFVVYKRIAHIR